MAETISPDELRDRIDAGASFALVDTRDDESFESWRIPGAIQYTFKQGEEIDPEAFEAETGLTTSDQIVTVCAKGISSFEFAEKLAKAGYEDVTVVENGMEGWSAVYDVTDVPSNGSVEIVQFQRRAKGCLSYLVADGEAKTAAAIDPTRHVDEFVRVAADRGWEIERVFDTHVHADHVSGGRRLADSKGVPYHLGENAAGRDVLYDYDPVERNEVVEVGTVAIKAVETPGHTSEMVCYLVDSDAICTGDTLFVESVGRTELQFGDGDAERGALSLYESLHRTVLAEPDALSVLPGHFPLAEDGTTSITPGRPVSTTIGTARTELVLLQEDETTFVESITGSLPGEPANYEAIIDVNTGRREPSDESEAAALETGPNNCAATSD